MSKKITSIQESFRPLLLLNSIFGLSIFEVPSGQPWPKLSIIYVVGRSIIYSVFLWYSQRYGYRKSEILPTMSGVVEVILYGNVIIAAISTILGIMNYKVNLELNTTIYNMEC